MMVLLLSSMPAPQEKLHVAPTPAAPPKSGATGSQKMTNRTSEPPNHLSEARCPGRWNSQLICDGFVALGLPAGDLCSDTLSSKRGAEDPDGTHPVPTWS